MKLKDKAIIITGATSGIGEASAMLFAREGGSVTIAGRSRDEGARVAEAACAAGGQAIFVATDVTQPADIEALFDAHMKRFGRLDVLFNNASYEGPARPVWETSDEQLETVLATNFKSVFRTSRLAAPIMRAAGSGSIINTTAGSAREGCAWMNLGPYIGSKGAVIAFTRALAVELAPYSIRVNSLNPGIVDTAMIRRYADKQDDPDAYMEILKKEQLLKRIAHPDEIARAALFLASEDSSFVTGTDMLVDGGLVLNR